MSSEPKKDTGPDGREERAATFSRRGLLQWSVPAILAVSLPSVVMAGGSAHGDEHEDSHVDSHIDSHQDSHQDSHTDEHTDFANQAVSPS